MWTSGLKILSALVGLPSLIKGMWNDYWWNKDKQKISDLEVEIAEFEGQEKKNEIIKNIERSPNRLRTIYDDWMSKGNNAGEKDK